MNPWVGYAPPDAVYCIGRALILGILVSSELAVAGRKRVDFERHLLLALGFGALLAAELFAGSVSVLWREHSPESLARLWLLYPALNSVGLVVIAYACDFCRFQGDEAEVRRRGRFALGAAAGLLVAGLALALTAPVASLVAAQWRGAPPSSVENAGWRSVALHGLQALAALWLILEVRHHDPGLVTMRQSAIFAFGGVAYAAGALLQMAFGPREHLTTLAFGIFAAVLLRYLYIESALMGVRGVERTSARMLMFHRITTELKSTLNEHELCEILLDGLLTNLGAESGAVFFCDERRQFLRAELVFGPLPPPQPPKEPPADEAALHEAVRRARVAVGEGLLGRVAASGRTEYVFNAALPGGAPSDAPPGLKTAIVMPLQNLDHVFGVVQVANRHDGASFTEEDVRFMSLVVEHGSLALANARLQKQQLRAERTVEQLRLAREIQQRMIPESLEEVAGLRTHAVYRPANEVGGDSYDLYRLDEDHVGLVIVDVSGKGVPAALVMTLTTTALRTLAPGLISPRESLIRLNRALARDVRRGMFVTVAYAVIDLRARVMKLSSAGHEPVLVCRPGQGVCELHRPRGAAIGLLPPERFDVLLQEETIELHRGDVVLMYTDGVTEAMDTNRAPFGVERLRDLALSHGSEAPRELLGRVVEAIERHSAGAPQYDDITLVALQVNGEPPAGPGGEAAA